MLQETFADAQTSITCLGAAVSGAVANRIGNYVTHTLKLQGNGLGGAGLEFCARAVICAGVFAGTAYVMPETSSNVLFSIMFFASEGKLVGTGVRIGNLAVNLALAVFPKSDDCCAGKNAAAKCGECK